MSRFLIIFFILAFVASPSFSDDIETYNILPVQLNISSKNFKYLFTNGMKLKSGSNVGSPIFRYEEPYQASMTRLDKERFHLEFTKPFKFSVYNSWDQQFMADQAVRSVTIMTRKDQLDKVMQLYRGRYFVIDGSTNEQMQKIVDEAQVYGPDHLIREFHLGRLAPRVLKFDSLVFFIQFEALSNPDEIVVESFGMQTLDYSNVKFLANEDVEYIEDASINEIQRFIGEDEEPLVEAYLAAILKMTKRKKELIERGWLKAVLNNQPTIQIGQIPKGAVTQVESASQVESVSNVILFPKKLICRLLFRQ